MRKFAKSLVLSVSVALNWLPASAQEAFPVRPITLIVPYSAGGALDNIARSLASVLKDTLGVSVVVENKPGGNNVVAARALMQSKPDGYTLMLTTNGMLTIGPVLYESMPFDARKDFSNIGMVSGYPYILVAQKDRFSDFSEFVERVRERKGRVSMAYTGHVKSIAVDMLGAELGSSILKVPYRGDNEAITDLSSGLVDAAMLGPSVAMPLIESGRLQPLAVTSAQRLDLVGEVPAVAEQVHTYTVVVWTALIGPKGMPQDRVHQIYEALRKVQESPVFFEHLERSGEQVILGDGKQLAQNIDAELKRWEEVMFKAKIEKLK